MIQFELAHSTFDFADIVDSPESPPRLGLMPGAGVRKLRGFCAQWYPFLHPDQSVSVSFLRRVFLTVCI
jgi:hypothetical protein